MVIVALYFWDMHYPSTKLLKYSNFIVNPSKYPEENKEICFHYQCQTLWSATDTIINARDPMQNPGQTRIFHKPGQTCFTWTKCD